RRSRAPCGGCSTAPSASSTDAGKGCGARSTCTVSWWGWCGPSVTSGPARTGTTCGPSPSSADQRAGTCAAPGSFVHGCGARRDVLEQLVDRQRRRLLVARLGNAACWARGAQRLAAPQADARPGRGGLLGFAAIGHLVELLAPGDELVVGSHRRKVVVVAKRVRDDCHSRCIRRGRPRSLR